MEKSSFSQEFSQELYHFLSQFKDVMSTAGLIANMITDKATEEWYDKQERFLLFQDEVKNNQDVFLVCLFIGAGFGIFSVSYIFGRILNSRKKNWIER